MLNKVMLGFKKALLWQKIFIIFVASVVIYFLISLSLYSSWNREISKMRRENQQLSNQIELADILFENKAELSDSKNQIIKDLISKTASEQSFLNGVKNFCTSRGMRIDLLDTFTIIKEYDQLVRKRYVMKLKVSRFEQVHLLLRYMTNRTMFRIIKFEYDNGYLDLEIDVLFSR